MMHSIVPVILSGGAGSRLWPVSTQDKPKQFHQLAGDATMFAATLARVAPDIGHDEGVAYQPPMVVCGIGHARLVADEIAAAGRGAGTVLLEPMPRNTAPALAAAALAQMQGPGDALMLVLPADHVIAKPHALARACAVAAGAANAGKIVTFGIVPEGPETGYGYIKRAETISAGVFVVEAFVEKPDLATAQAYVASGDYAWNAGIFLFKASALIAELQAHAPEVLASASAALAEAKDQGGAHILDAVAFATAPAISIDYAVMERTANAAVAPVDMGWSDVGSFASLWEIGERDERDNAVVGPAAIFDSTGCLVRAGTVPISVIGVSDLMVVATETGILVIPRARAQDVRWAADAFKTRP
jgi:mannose-1-phosphate guanylyltransferase/mannose-6-phosphate isomerase